jgi:N-acetylmuramoyl-L-alanine amidase
MADASNEEAASLLELEEAGEVGPEEEVAADTPSGDVEAILADLRLADTHRGSARLARTIQDELATVATLSPSRGLRQAPFLVLRRARVPAVLVELGYLSHAKQGRSLAEKSTQKQAARALIRYVSARRG